MTAVPLSGTPAADTVMTALLGADIRARVRAMIAMLGGASVKLGITRTAQLCALRPATVEALAKGARRGAEPTVAAVRWGSLTAAQHRRDQAIREIEEFDRLATAEEDALVLLGHRVEPLPVARRAASDAAHSLAESRRVVRPPPTRVRAA